MTEDEARRLAMELAARETGYTTEEVLARARAYLEFLIGKPA